LKLLEVCIKKRHEICKHPDPFGFIYKTIDNECKDFIKKKNKENKLENKQNKYFENKLTSNTSGLNNECNEYITKKVNEFCIKLPLHIKNYIFTFLNDENKNIFEQKKRMKFLRELNVFFDKNGILNQDSFIKCFAKKILSQ